MTTPTNLVCWVILSGPTVDGEAIPIPARHRGLSWDSLADLGVAQNPPVADLIGKGLWRVHDASKPSLITGKVHSDPIYTPDAATSTVTRSWSTVNVADVPGGWAVERNKLLTKVRSNAEAARMRFLTAGDGKALTYEAKRQEAERWAAESSPRVLAGYRFALREAAALNDLDPFDDTELATVTEQQVSAVIAVYTARSAAFQIIGAQIEALEQRATATIEAQHNAAMVAYNANSGADLSSYESAMQAATVVSWPSP